MADHLLENLNPPQRWLKTAQKAKRCCKLPVLPVLTCFFACVTIRDVFSGDGIFGATRPEVSEMIDAREAVKRAAAYLGEISAPIGRQLGALEVEEVEKSDDEQYWLITLSYPRGPFSGLASGDEGKRVYKQFKVNAETGEVQSMTMREVHAS